MIEDGFVESEMAPGIPVIKPEHTGFHYRKISGSADSYRASMKKSGQKSRSRQRPRLEKVRYSMV